MKNMRRYFFGVISLFALLVSASNGNQVNKANVNIEIFTTPQIRIFNVTVKAVQSNVIVTGKLHKRSHSRTVIPGHIDITFLSPDNEMLQTIETKYSRASLKSRDSTFIVEIPLELEDGSTVRVEHFRKSNH